MDCIAALDYEHLENAAFLTGLARTISGLHHFQPLLIHGDSAYTERIMQTGVMRREATLRSIKGLNHRLVNLFADEGAPLIGLNGYQKKLITLNQNKLSVNRGFFNNLPSVPVLLSSLVWNEETRASEPLPLSRLASFLQKEWKMEAIYVFSSGEKYQIITPDKPKELKWRELSADFAKNNIPADFRKSEIPLRLISMHDFGSKNHLETSTFIH
jgi:hypothetical protein